MDPNRESTRYAEVTNRAGNWKITRAAISVGFRFAYRRGRDARKIVNSFGGSLNELGCAEDAAKNRFLVSENRLRLMPYHGSMVSCLQRDKYYFYHPPTRFLATLRPQKLSAASS